MLGKKYLLQKPVQIHFPSPSNLKKENKIALSRLIRHLQRGAK